MDIVHVEIADRERTNFTDPLEKSRDAMIAILPSLISRTDRIKHAISLCTFGMINMVFACNGRPIPAVDGVAVKLMYGTEIIEKQNFEHSRMSTR